MPAERDAPPDYGNAIQNVANNNERMNVQAVQRQKRLANICEQHSKRLDLLEARSGVPVGIESDGIADSEITDRWDRIFKALDALEMRFQEVETTVTRLESAQETNALAIERKISELDAQIKGWEEDAS